jgi:hypothetical protein
MAPSCSGDCNPERGTAGNGISSSLLVDGLGCASVEAWPEKITLGQGRDLRMNRQMVRVRDTAETDCLLCQLATGDALPARLCGQTSHGTGSRPPTTCTTPGL